MRQAGAHFLQRKTSLFHKVGRGRRKGPDQKRPWPWAGRKDSEELGLGLGVKFASLRTDIWLLRSLQGCLFWVPSPVGDAGACTLPGGSPSPCLYPVTQFNWILPPSTTAPRPDLLPPPHRKRTHFLRGKTKPILHTLGELWEVEASNYQLNLTFREFVGFTRLLHHKG